MMDDFRTILKNNHINNLWMNKKKNIEHKILHRRHDR